MAYNQSVVIAGGLAHIPVIILFFKYIEKRFNRRILNNKVDVAS